MLIFWLLETYIVNLIIFSHWDYRDRAKMVKVWQFLCALFQRGDIFYLLIVLFVLVKSSVSNEIPYCYSSVSFFLLHVLLFFFLFCARVFSKTARPIYIKNNIFWFELDRNFFYIDDLISVFEIVSIFILVFCLRTLIDIMLIFLMLVKEELKFCRIVVLYV